MKPSLMLLTLGLLGSITTSRAHAQSYVIDWFTFDGGGGQSTGGGYTLRGTIGQPDAGAMSGGPFTLVGGFWGVTVVTEEPPAPRLSIVLADPNTVIIAWPAPSTGFVLQQSSTLQAAGWGEVAAVPQVIGGQKQVVVSPPVGTVFYRLRKP